MSSSERLQHIAHTIKNIPINTITWIKNHKKISIPLLIIGCSLLLLNRIQKNLIYLPQIPGMPRSPSQNPYGYRQPSEQQIQYENVVINTSDNVQLRGWYCKALNSKRIIIYFHQNAGNIGFRIPFMKSIIERTQSSVLLIAYRGYSDSKGSPSQKGILVDSSAIMDKGIELSQGKPIYLFGRSLGGAVAIDVGSKRMVNGLIIENTFTCMRDVVSHLFSFLSILRGPIIWLVLNNYWNSVQKIKDIKADILFIKSRRDQLIPTSLMDELQREANKNGINTQQYEIINGTHNDSWGLEPSKYFRKWNQFFRRVQQ